MRGYLRRGLQFLVIICLLCSGTAVGLVDTGTQQESASADISPVSGPIFQQDSNTTPVRHTNPNEADSDDSLSALQRELANRLTQRLEQSSANITQGDYEQAQALLGDDYADLLDKYAEVAAETNGEESATRFEQAQQQQQSLTTELSEYQRTLEEYRSAKAAGNETQARRLARELIRIEGNIQQNVSELNDTYTEIGSQTEINTTAGQQQTQAVSQNVSETRSEIRREEFTETNLTARTETPTGTFTDPIRVFGTLQTEAGTPIQFETVNITVGTQQYTVSTNETGEFTLRYRPVTQPVGDGSVTVSYQPTATSLYLGSHESVNVSVSQSTAEIQIQNVSQPIGFGDRFSLQGRIIINETPVGNVPLSVSIDNQTVLRGVTAPNGSFAFETQLNATITPGERSLVVRSLHEDRAITVSPQTRSLEIVGRTPTLTAMTQLGENESVTVSGQLTGPSGTPLENETIAIYASDRLIAEVSTTQDGSFEQSISADSLPSTVSELTVQYADTESNLESVSTGVSLPPSVSGTQNGLLTTILHRPLIMILLLGSVLTLSSGGVYAYRKRQSNQPTTVDPSEDQGERTENKGSDKSDQQAALTLTAAEAALEKGQTDEAIIMAYLVLRQQLAAQYTVDTQTTHWQFYQAIANTEFSFQTEFKDLTSRYEQARYAIGSSDAEIAQEVLATAQGIRDAATEQTTPN